MKRTTSIWLSLPAAAGLLAFALLPALAQAPAAAPAVPAAPAGPVGKVHGHVTNPTGASQAGGTVTLVPVGRVADKAEKLVSPVDANGDYKIDAPPGTYTAVYRTPGMADDKQADKFDNVKVVVGQDTAQDVDMSRKEYVDALPPEQKKQLEDLKKHNAEAMKANEVIKTLNADLKVVTQDIKDAEASAAHATAVQVLGATASKADLDAKEAEIKTGKYTEIESLMKKDTDAKPDASILWAQLGQAQLGLKKYDEAEASYKKALALEADSKKPNISIQGLANSGLGEIYARTGKVPEATAAYDAAAKVNPTQAGFYLKNEAVIYFQTNNGDAQIAAAEEAIAADPNQAILYYLKGQGLIQKATFDAKAQKIILPPGCAEAYQKYLDLAPTGPYAGEVKGILDQAGQKVTSTYKADKKK